jgi:hypothetical protein
VTDAQKVVFFRKGLYQTHRRALRPYPRRLSRTAEEGKREGREKIATRTSVEQAKLREQRRTFHPGVLVVLDSVSRAVQSLPARCDVGLIELSPDLWEQPNMSEESDIAARSAQVSAFLEKKDKASALAACLQNPPVNAKSEELKVRRKLCYSGR